MRSSKILLFFLILATGATKSVLAVDPVAPLTAPSPIQTYKIMLFDHWDCTVTTTTQKSEFLTLREISPEKIKPVENQQQAEALQKKLAKAKGYPKELVGYVAQFKKYAAAMKAFFIHIKTARKNIPSFLKKIKPHLAKKDTQELAELIKNKADSELIFSSYKEIAAPYPDKEFQDVTEKKLGFKYDCNPLPPVNGTAEEDDDLE